MRNQLGSLLEKIRKEKKLTLRQVADKTGMSFSYIRSIEINQSSRSKGPISPSPDTLRKLALAYDYPYEDLMKAAGFISDDGIDPLNSALEDPTVSDKRKRLIELIKEMSDDQIDSWLKIIDSVK